MIVYAIMDTAMGAMIPETLMASHNDEVYRRFLRDSITGNHPIARHPEDYVAFSLGEWDPNAISFVPGELSVPRSLGSLRSILAGADRPIQEES